MPIYIFSFSTIGPQTVTLEVQNPPLELGLSFDGVWLSVKIFMYGSHAFHLEVTTEEPLVDIGRVAGGLSNAMSGLYDALGLATGNPLTLRLDGFQLVGTRTFGAFSQSLPHFGEAIRLAGLNPHD